MPIIRPFQFNDIAAITAIYADAVINGTASYEIDPPCEKDMRGRFTVLVAEGFPVLVALEDNVIVGYAYAGHFRKRPAYRWMVEDSIYVAPDAKGRGVGKLLLSELIQVCAALGFRQLLAVIGDGEGNAGSVRLHQSAGFRECGRLEGSGFKHGRWLDTVLMQLPLNGGNTTLASAPPLKRLR